MVARGQTYNFIVNFVKKSAELQKGKKIDYVLLKESMAARGGKNKQIWSGL